METVQAALTASDEALASALVDPCTAHITLAVLCLETPEDLARATLIFDESVATGIGVPRWPDWLAAAGVTGVDLSRGLRFNSADHAVDAAVEGAGVLLAYYTIAYDDLRLGRLVAPFDIRLETERAFHFVCPADLVERPKIAAFRDWLRRERDAMLACPLNLGGKVVKLGSTLRDPGTSPKAARRAR